MDVAVDPSLPLAHTRVVSLVDLPKGRPALVAGLAPDEQLYPYLADRLAELGFLPGEQVRVLAYGPLGREPLAVRVGTATFALRRHEAACVRVIVDGLRP